MTSRSSRFYAAFVFSAQSLFSARSLRNLGVFGMLALFGAAGAGRTTQAQASGGSTLSADEIMKRSLSFYQNMTSYEGKANTDTLLIDSSGKILKQVGTSNEMKFKRPNRLILTFMTPLGTRIVYGDNAKMYVYDVSDRKYLMQPTAPTVKELLPKLFKFANVTASFDPLYGFSNKTMPTEMINLKLKATSTFNGHPVYVITGRLATSQPSDWTWWIDRNTYQFYKIEQALPNVKQTVIVQNKGNTTSYNRQVMVLMRSVITNARPNAPVSDGDFVFKIPAGVTPRNSTYTASAPQAKPKH